jgi:asparagine synthase (glutamine-hydrolysing)
MRYGSTTRAFAGVFAQRSTQLAASLSARVDTALAPDGPAQSLEDGPLALAWSNPQGPGAPGSGRAFCLLDGHVYNLPELVDGDWPDAAAALAHLYARDGSGLLPRLRGDFSLLIWDRISRTGLLARDQLGGRPLHVHRNGATLAFASELRNLTRLMPAGPAPDAGAVDEWLATGAPPSGRTLFEGVHTLEPASWIALGRFGPSGPMRYWEPRYRPPERMSRQEATDAVRESVFQAVRRRGEDDGRSSALLLSGGIDSASVAATSAAVLDSGQRPRRAYTVTFPGHPEIDEGPLTATVAAAAGLRATSLRLASGSVLAGALPYIEAWDTPPSSPNLFFLRPLLARARADAIRVMLDGEGGDAVFWHAPVLLADRLRAGRLVAAWSLAGRFPEYGEPTTVRRRARELRHWGRMAANTGDAPAAWSFLLDGIVGPGSRLLHDVSRRHAAMAGLEARHPLLDVDLIELALRLPPELAFDRRYNRPLLRHAMDGLVPDDVRLRPYKSRFDPVFIDAMRSDRRAIERLLLAPTAELRAFVDPGELQAVRETPPADPAGERERAMKSWTLAMLECWLRRLAGRNTFPANAGELVTATAGDIGRL